MPTIPYKVPNGPLDRATAQHHVAKVTAGWTEPLWVYRSGQLDYLLRWCIERYTAEAVARRKDAAGLEDALYAALEFAGSVHSALNTEGADAIKNTPKPSSEDREQFSAWDSLVQRVWNHNDPSESFQMWRAAYDRKEIVHFPRRCNKAAVIDVADEYFRRPWVAHPWLEWCFLDALVRHEVIAFADEIVIAEFDPFRPNPPHRSAFAAFLSRGSDRRRAENLWASTAPLRQALAAVSNVYARLQGEGWSISPTRLRETMVAIEQMVQWDPVFYVLVDRAIARNPAVWDFSPNQPAVAWT